MPEIVFCERTKSLIMKLCIFSLLLLLHITATAQLHSDCATAITICNDQILTITTSGDHGVTEQLGPPCVDEDLSILEFGSNWFAFSFVSTGVFYFTITPDQFDRDIDFVVFESPNSSCNNYFPVRCMAAGENIGDPIDSICLGPTGLSPESQDFFEVAGCASNHDNFLAALNVQSGDSYYLAVIDFTANEADSFHYDIDFFSTALFECEPVSVGKNLPEIEDVIVFPNPIADRFEININSKSNLDNEIQIHDVNGLMVYSGMMESEEKKMIDTKDWVSGIYFLRIMNAQQAKTLTLVKL